MFPFIHRSAIPRKHVSPSRSSRKNCSHTTKNPQHVRGFMGLMSDYRNSLHHFVHIASSSHCLIKNLSIIHLHQSLYRGIHPLRTVNFTKSCLGSLNHIPTSWPVYLPHRSQWPHYRNSTFVTAKRPTTDQSIRESSVGSVWTQLFHNPTRDDHSYTSNISSNRIS